MVRLFHGVPECAVDLADARGCLDGFATTEQAVAALAELIAPYCGPEPDDYELAERAMDALIGDGYIPAAMDWHLPAKE